MKRLLTSVVMTLLILTLVFSTTACNSDKNAEENIITIKSNQFSEYVTADGNLVMPHEVKLKFNTPGTVKSIYVQKGERVKAGKLLAKLDDSKQKIAITAAQYDVELALNELAEKIYPSLLGYPHFYPSYTALLRVEQAQGEISAAVDSLEQKEYLQAASDLRIAYHDLQQSKETLKQALVYIEDYPETTDYLVPTYFDPRIVHPYVLHPGIPNAIEAIEQNLSELENIQNLMDKGSYESTAIALNTFVDEMEQTHNSVNSACGSIVKNGIEYPDASTSLSVMQQVMENLNEIQRLLNEENLDQLEVAEKLRIAMHDVEASRDILQDNELLVKHGLNMKVLRYYNLNFEKAEAVLEKAKQDLMDTELLAPFEGVVIEIGIKENDLLSAYDYATTVAAHLVDTATVEMNGVVDEIDIFKIAVGQKALVSIDALPGEELSGTVTFISPYSSEVVGIVNYPVTIMLDSANMELKSGLTATARIIVEGKPETIYVPRTAVNFEDDKYFVQVVLNAEKMVLEEREVKIGAQSAQNIEILSGLKEGDKILSRFEKVE